jgi:propionate CoA-transferase
MADKKKVISEEEAIALIQDGDVLATTGYVGHGTPDQLYVDLEERFLRTGTPTDLTLIHSTGQGDGEDKGLNRLAHEGLLKRIIAGHFGLAPKIAQLVLEEKIEAYNISEGAITHLFRNIAAGKPGTISKVGLGTFVDPRLDGGRMNARTQEQIVEVVELAGEEWLFYKAIPINIAFIRGTTADVDGNISMERESVDMENLSIAMAAKNSGGLVICQVERVAASGSLNARLVRVPGVMVDAVVVAEEQHHMQSYGTSYNPAFSGEIRVPLDSLERGKLNERKIIARRAAMELLPNSIVNLGIGMPDGVAAVANEERIQDYFTLTADPGIFGGVPMGGLNYGAAVNATALIDHAYQFDFIDGGGLDLAVLGMGECDARGNVNVSRFGERLAGCGGFINISQNSREVLFVGTFTSGGLKTSIQEGTLRILEEGKNRKFIGEVEQITFNGALAAKKNTTVYYITERCVFKLTQQGLELIEVAPGIDIERDILAQMDFAPEIGEPAPMDERLFAPEPMGLKDSLVDMPMDSRFSYDPESNTIFMNFAGLRVRNVEDVAEIREATEGRLKGIGKKVNSVVNYDAFTIDDDVVNEYADLVRYIETNYYLSVSRYTTSGFLRRKLGKELVEKRGLSPSIYETEDEAKKRVL